MIKETNNTDCNKIFFNSNTNKLDDANNLSSITQSLINQTAPLVECSSRRFTQLPNDLLGLLFKNMGPSLLMFVSTCTTCQQILNIPGLKTHRLNLQKYKQALDLLRQSYRLKRNVSFIETLTLMFPNCALEQAKKLPYFKEHAFKAIAKSYIPFNSEKALDALNLAKDAIHEETKGNLSRIEKLTPIAKISKNLDHKLTRELLNFESDTLFYNKNRESYEQFEIIANVAETLHSVEPKKALNLIKNALNKLKVDNRFLNQDEKIRTLKRILTVFALFDIESTLSEVNIIWDDGLPEARQHFPYSQQKKNEILISIIDTLATDNPERALSIAENSFKTNPLTEAQDLITYAKVLTMCNQKDKAAPIKEQAITLAQDSYTKLKIARVLAQFDPERAITILNEVLQTVLLATGFWSVTHCLKNIFEILNDLNDEKTITAHIESVFQKVKNIHDLGRENPGGFCYADIYSTITSIAVALAPFDLTRALEIADIVKSSTESERANIWPKMALNIIKKASEL